MCVENKAKEDVCLVGKVDMKLNKWFHITVVHQYPKVCMYVNGELNVSGEFNGEWISDDYPVGIGNQSQFPNGGRSWDGWLDEARVLSTVKDEHWIKLDFESQREGQRFLSLGKTIKRK